jgi:hypothetical protein
MSAAAHNPAFAKAVKIPQKIGKDYIAATKNYKKLPESVNVSRGTRSPRG